MFVLDCSVALTWCFASEATQGALSVLERLEAGEHAISPSIFSYEIANALTVAQRSRRLNAESAAAFQSSLNRLPVIVEQTSAAVIYFPIRDLAQRFGLSVYDAAYLELAKREGLPLATLDLTLIKAAREEGVSLLTGDGG